MLITVSHIKVSHTQPAWGATVVTWRRHVAVLHGGIACGGALMDSLVSGEAEGWDVLT